MTLQLLAFLVSSLAFAASNPQPSRLNPPGGPGIPHRWAPALKQAVGTSYESASSNSPVWFTLAEGVVTEVFYPYVDEAQIGDLQFIITDGESFFSEQKRDTVTHVQYKDDGMTVRVEGYDRQGAYRYVQEIVTDDSAPVLRIATHFQWNRPNLKAYILFKPAIQNSGAENLGHATHEGLFASRRSHHPVHAALVIPGGFRSTSAGYVGFSDGWQDLSKNFRLTQDFRDVGPGNIALTGEIPVDSGDTFTFDMALGFGRSQEEAHAYASTSLEDSFTNIRKRYETGWKEYLADIENSPLGGKQFFRSSVFARRSAQIIKMHEDKQFRGAIVASLSKPAIPDSDRAFDGIGGYHLVWPRDLYHAAMGLLAAGDVITPINVLHYLRATQVTAGNLAGSWYQNFWVNGVPYWSGLQMDEVAFPILLAWHLQNRGVYSLTDADRQMIRSAANFIATHGPKSPQDRWEEIGGYIPSTIAAEISALDAASRILEEPSYGQVASSWRARLESWTLVPNGPYGKNYYLRTSPFGRPSEGEVVDLANGAGRAFASEIIDGGFLDLVRMGIRSPEHPYILNTLRVYETPQLGIHKGMTYRRYNRDQYGPYHVGGYWPLLAGERGHYSVKAGDLKRAEEQLRVLERSALPSGVLPEQTVDAPGQTRLTVGAGVACPLVWAHAEDILLHRSIEEGQVFDSP